MLDWTFAPDWTEVLLERLEWLTEVTETRTGKEQRARLRAHPRRHLEYLVTAGDDAARVRLENLIIAGHGAGYMAPAWTDYAHLAAPAAAGGATVSAPTEHRDFTPGARVALVGRDGDAEAATLASVAAGVLTLAAPLVRAWPLGTKVVPLRAARLAGSFSVGYPCDAVAATVVQWRFEAEHVMTPASETADYRGYPVLTTPTNWDDDPSAEYARKLEVFDGDVGLVEEADVSGVATVTRSHRWLLASRAEQAAFRAWLAARAGRLTPFWLPSLQVDVRLLAGIGAAATTINVENRGHALTGEALGRRDILIQTHAGARYYRRIVDVLPVDAASEQIVLDAPLGVAVALDDLRGISFMRLVRLASDAVEIAHYTDEAAIVQLGLASIRDDV